MHDGSQGFHRAATGAWNALSMRDPWDEEYYLRSVDARFRAMPHAAMTDAERWRLAQEFTRPVFLADLDGAPVAAPLAIPLLRTTGLPGVVATAMYRDTDLAVRSSTEHVNRVAQVPVLVRLVELDGVGGTVEVEVVGTVDGAWLTNTLGEVREKLEVEGCVVRVPMRAHGIATLALDIAEARPVSRNLDAHREVWAQVHREHREEEA
jgi:alpha-mannosidase